MGKPINPAYRPLSNSDALIGITIQAGDLLNSLRDELGRFTSLQSEAVAIHREIARGIQRTQADTLAQRIDEHGRPQDAREQGERLLQRAIESSDYIDYTGGGFRVGTSEFDEFPLNTYWRHIEFGSRVFVGRILHGYYRQAGGRSRWPPLESRYPIDARLIQVLEFHEAGTGLKRMGKENGFPFDIEIRRPIPAYHFLEAGYEKYGIEINEDGEVGVYDASIIADIYERYLAQFGIRMTRT